MAQIRTGNALILALIEEDADLNNTEGSDAARGIPVNMSTNFTLNVTLASTGYSNDVIGLASANIGEVNAVATANIGEINGL